MARHFLQTFLDLVYPNTGQDELYLIVTFKLTYGGDRSIRQFLRHAYHRADAELSRMVETVFYTSLLGTEIFEKMDALEFHGPSGTSLKRKLELAIDRRGNILKGRFW